MQTLQQILSTLTAIVITLSGQFSNLNQTIDQTNQLAAVAPTSGLVGYWNLNEGSGSTASDSSGNSNTGSLQASPTWTASGKVAGGLTLNGTTQYISIPDSSSLDLNQGTIAAWVNVSALGRWHSIVAKGNTSPNNAHNYSLEIDNGNLAICIIGSGADNQVLRSTATIPANTFTHIACSFDGSNLRVYINGSQNSTATQTITPAINISPLYIGQFGGNNDRLQGTVDEVRIYNRALSASEVADVFNDTGGPPPAPDTQAPSVPTNLNASAVSSSQINLTWSASSDNIGVTGYRVFRNGNQIATPSTNSYSNTGLSPSTQYSYTVAAVDAAGNVSSQSSSASATTQAAPPQDTQAPTVPANLNASTVSSSQINLTWTASTDNIGVTGYRVFRNGNQVGTPSTNSYNDTGLSASTQYSYTVSAQDTAGNSSNQSSSASATTLSTPPPPPPPPPPPVGTVHHVRIGASGNGSGNDWTNACNGFVGSCAGSSMVRGHTYYVADGTYPSTDFTTPTSGTTRITIKKATQAEHGVDTGWSSAYGDGNARWFSNSGGIIDFSTGYWTFDGATGGGPTAWKTGLGFVVDSSVATETGIAVSGPGVTISRTEVIGDGDDGDGVGGSNDGIYYGSGATGSLLEYSYIHHQGRTNLFIRPDNTTIQYSWFEHNESTPGEHSEGISAWRQNSTRGDEVRNLVIRYNVWKDIEGTGGIVCDCNGWDVYGNVFWGTGGAGTGHGAVTWWPQDDILNVRVYNNTFINAHKAVMFGCDGGCGVNSNISVYNNLMWHTDSGMQDPEITSHDYNAFSSDDPFGTLGEAHAQVISSDPFVNFAGDNFHLKAATNPASSFGAPFNIDPDGNVRGQDGTWDRGAFEFGGVPPAPDNQAPSTPTSLSASAISSSAISLTWNPSTDNVGVLAYRIYRSGVQIGTSGVNSYTDTGLNPLTSYSYTVAAYDASLNVSAQSSSASATTPAAAAPVLRAAYGFEANSGTTVSDSSGNNNTGTFTGSPTWTTLGKFGNALAFNGGANYVTINDSASTDITGSGTLEVSVKPATLNRWSTLIAKGNVNSDPAHNYGISLDNLNRVVCFLGNGSSSNTLTSVGTVTSTSAFTHLACTWDGSTIKIYINGVLSSSLPQGVTLAANTSPLYIGQGGGDVDRVNGVLDEIRIYSGALSQAQIQTDMNTAISSPSGSTRFSPGQRVQTTSNLNVRATANGTLLGTQPLGVLGTILGGGTQNGANFWWNINYDSGVDGWSVEDFLAAVVVTPPPPPPPSATPIPGDLNLDHVVNSLDFSLLNSRWNQNFPSYDLVVDNLINSLDFAVLSSNWGKTW